MAVGTRLNVGEKLPAKASTPTFLTRKSKFWKVHTLAQLRKIAINLFSMQKSFTNHHIAFPFDPHSVLTDPNSIILMKALEFFDVWYLRKGSGIFQLFNELFNSPQQRGILPNEVFGKNRFESNLHRLTLPVV